MNLAKLVGQVDPTAGLRLRQAYVVSVETSPTSATIRLGGNAGAGDDIAGVRHLEGVPLAAGDIVSVLQAAGALLIIGRIATTAAARTQAASTVAVTDGSGNVSVTFPEAFATIDTIVCINGDRNQGTFWFNVVGGGLTTTGCTFRVDTPAGALLSTTIRFNWIAVGT